MPELISTNEPVLTAAPAPPSSCEEIVAALRHVEALHGLFDDEYRWLAEHGAERKAPPETMLFREGDPAEFMTIMLAGEVHVRRKQTGNLAFFIARIGQMSGILPFSRMKGYGGTGYSVGNVWAIEIHRDKFPEMLAAIPSMGQRCVSVLLNRVREVTRMEQQAEKLAALGKLAANLAHELNNPASAAQRSAASLFSELRQYGEQKYRLGSARPSPEEHERYTAWAERTRSRIAAFDQPSTSALSPLDQSDREDTITRWLEAHHIPKPWTIAPALAETAVAPAQLDELAAICSPELLPLTLSAFASALRVERMAETVVDSTVRIFDLISAIKDYSYMDQAPIQEIDLAQSLDTTLSMFPARLARITVERNFDPALPLISAYGSELNQVWTELIENALDAMETADPPRNLRISTRLTGEIVVVEVWDSGPGIPPDVQSRIFEPFFTTKGPGIGLGLGLDGALRIVSKHSGQLTVSSKPGATCFQVRLPLDRAQAY